MLLILTLALLTFLTAIISGVVGMAGGVTLLAFMSFLLPLPTIVPIHGVVQLFSNSSRCFFLRKKIDRLILLYFLIGAPLGTLCTYLLLQEIENRDVFFLLIVALIFYTLFKPQKLPALVIPKKAFIILGFSTGLLSPLIGATGPLLAPFFLREDLDKETIVATKAAAQMFTHLLKIPLFLAMAFPYQDYALLLITMIFMAILGTKTGVLLLGRVGQVLFVRIYKVALFLAGLRLLYKLYAA